MLPHPDHIAAARHLAELMAQTPVIVNAAKAAATIDDVVSGYGDDLSGLVQELLRGGHQLSKADFRRDMKKAIKDWAKQVFEVAWEEGGGSIDETETDDLALLQDFVSEQQSHVSDFSDWLTDKETDLDEAPERVDLWEESMQNFGERVKLRAEGDPMIYLDGDDGEESCDECQEYKGKDNAHRLSWWEKRGLTARNGNENFGCRRFAHCHHSYYYVKNGELAIA